MRFNILVIIVLLIALLTGCQDVLDKHDLNVVDDQIWNNEVQATLFVNKLYEDNMPDMDLGKNSQLSDETYSSSSQYTDLLYGFYGESSIDAVKVLHKDKYKLIRQINICIDGLENESALSDEIKGPIEGQALFFRAFRYFEFVKLYGGVPMVLKVQDPFSEDLNVPRSKTSESIDLIVADLDKAIASLPVDWPLTEDKGRITSGAAAAFKGRVLLFWASPMFNPNNDQDRWQRAYDANNQAIELLSLMNTPRDLNSDFSTIFTTDVNSNAESVIYKRYDVAAGSDYTSSWENSVRPPSAGGNGGYNPTWELVKAFPMANGRLINETGSGYDSTYFWKNRDPRFYATVVYNGAEWSMNGRDETTQWTYQRNPHEQSRTPSTGFYCRKATDPTISETNVSQTNTTWHELRYAEVLLNFAECANEIGNKDEALTNIRRIRERAGIEAGNGDYGISNSISKEELRERIMIERQIEFAFENKRYWDLRRRLMFRQDLGQYVKKLNGTQRHGFTIRVNGDWLNVIDDPESPYNGQTRLDSAYSNGYIDINDSESYNTYFTTSSKVMESYVSGQTQSINYLALYDYFAISKSILQSSPAVEQTVGWLDGTFDPLAE